MDNLFNNKYFKQTIYFILGVGSILYATSLLSFEEQDTALVSKLLSQKWYLIILGIFIYLLSHTFRVLRLVLLSPNSNYKIRLLWKEQYKANGVNLMLPFKLGESYRLIYFKQFFGSYANSFAVLVCERMLDLVTMISILMLTIYFSEMNIPVLNYVLYISLILLGILLFTLYVLDEILGILNRVLIQKDSSKLSVQIIGILSNIIKAIKKIKSILSQKYVSCFSVTTVIWILEITVFCIFFELLNQRIDLIILLALAVSFSSLLPGGPLGYGGLQVAFYSIGIAANIDNLVNYSLIYGVFIFGSGLAVASLFFLYDFFKGSKQYN